MLGILFKNKGDGNGGYPGYRQLKGWWLSEVYSKLIIYMRASWPKLSYNHNPADLIHWTSVRKSPAAIKGSKISIELQLWLEHWASQHLYFKGGATDPVSLYFIQLVINGTESRDYGTSRMKSLHVLG